MTYRNTKQKKLILQILQGNKIHPTIQEIYSLAKKEDSTIGQATVYRIVKSLAEQGIIKKLQVDNKECHRYDIDITKHDHMICKKCGKIIDLFDNDYNNIISLLEKEKNFKIEKMSVVFEGLCPTCNIKE